MLPNPFSEEDAQRYIAEFKSWPHEFPPDQLVYAGFRSAATPSSADKVNCYGCSAFVEQWHDPSKALQEHLRQTPACPIALEIKQSRLEIEAEIRQITLAQLVKQRDIRRKSALKILAAPQQQALLPSIENSHSVETKDTYLLQLYRNRATLLASSPWHFSGMHLLPVSPLIPALDIAVYNFPSGLLEAIEEVLGEEFMDGWELYFIEKYATNNATVNVNLLLVKTMVETKDDGMQAECQTPSEWTPTPGTSVVDGQ